MKQILELIEKEVKQAFREAGYDEKYGKVTLSNRPDLCEYQCNGALAAAKEYRKAPIMIAKDCQAVLAENTMFSMADAAAPGFINLKLSDTYLAAYLNEMAASEKFGLEEAKKPETIIVDYGGANVAKPLHVGHLRPAIIGESIKRIGKYMGHHMLGDVHLGDWGLQIGLIITEVQHRWPDLPYFDENYEGEYPKEPPFSLEELSEIYPAASARSKEDAAYREAALLATRELQQGRRGYRALWQHILNVSIPNIKKNYDDLNVFFELWKKESDVDPYIPQMVEDMKAKGIAYLDDGALIVDVKEETDAKEVPPCIILKSDGSALYATTDIATILEREKLYQPDRIIYVVDKRQEMHFTQVFRCVKKAGIVEESVKLQFVGFGTMNGKDGKPFKTRDGGVMHLEQMVSDINEEMYRKIVENHSVDEAEARKTAKIVGLSALKYGDLSNQASKDYVFDMERFTSFEGNTGPYILYTIVRIKSILNKYAKLECGGEEKLMAAQSESEKALMLLLTQFAPVVENACEENAPHKICSFIYEVSNAFNRFYHETKIMGEEDKKKQASWIALLRLTKDMLETCIGLLGFEAPEKM